MKIVIMENGPIIIEGKKRVALCRCGHSNNKPYCDGSHRNADFKAAGVELDL
ncbi:MAG: CDGSH iron-sulfur domain-containing protein [Candidatus Nitrosocaldaceae archaeon]